MFAHHPAIFIGLLLFFVGFAHAYERYQDRLILREGLMVAFFLAGLIVLGGHQKWWLQPVLTGMDSTVLFFGATLLTAITDNAALTYLGSLLEGTTADFRYSLVAGAVAGGGLTVIANAPNPAGFSILKGSFKDEAIHPLGLLAAALPPTIVAVLAFRYCRSRTSPPFRNIPVLILNLRLLRFPCRASDSSFGTQRLSWSAPGAMFRPVAHSPAFSRSTCGSRVRSAANFTRKTDLHPLFDPVCISQTRILAQGVKQYNNDWLAGYVGLHHQAPACFAEKAGFRYTDFPIGATHQIVRVDKLHAMVVIVEFDGMRSGCGEFANNLVVICRTHQFGQIACGGNIGAVQPSGIDKVTAAHAKFECLSVHGVHKCAGATG